MVFPQIRIARAKRWVVERLSWIAVDARRASFSGRSNDHDGIGTRHGYNSVLKSGGSVGTTNTLTRLADQPALDRVAEPLSKAVRRAYESAGSAGAEAKNALHGVWLGHPLHPVFTDLPVGAWTTALALDAAAGGAPRMHRAATFALGVGLVGAAGAAVSGLTDWSETDGRSRRTGLIHGLLNIAATSLVAAAYVRRRSDSHSGGRALAWAGYTIAVGSAYLGGDLVYGQRIGVTHAAVDEPDAFTPVAPAAELPDGTMKRARKDDVKVLVAPQS